MNATVQVVRNIFDFIWRDGGDSKDEWPALCAGVALDEHEARMRVAGDSVKQVLRTNSDQGICHRVFGMPSLVVNKTIF